MRHGIPLELRWPPSSPASVYCTPSRVGQDIQSDGFPRSGSRLAPQAGCPQSNIAKWLCLLDGRRRIAKLRKPTRRQSSVATPLMQDQSDREQPRHYSWPDAPRLHPTVLLLRLLPQSTRRHYPDDYDPLPIWHSSPQPSSPIAGKADARPPDMARSMSSRLLIPAMHQPPRVQCSIHLVAQITPPPSQH